MKKLLIIGTVFMIILLSNITRAGTLKSILIILDEYENPGLNSISVAVKKDFANIRYFIKLLKKRKVIRVAKPIILRGAYATKSRLKKIIKNIRLTKSDVLLIYFSGHGGIGRKNKLYLAMYDDSYVYRHELESAIKRKKARLKIIITDACSNSIAGLPEGSGTRSIRLKSAWSTKNLKILFNNYHGLYYITAASKGEFAYGDPIVGGWFTESIIQEVLIQNPPATWKEVSEQTKENTLIKFRERLPGNKRSSLSKEGITGQNPMTFSYPLLIKRYSVEIDKLLTPKRVIVSEGDYKNKIVISWKKVKGANKYIIYKYYKNAKKWEYVTNTNLTKYEDKNIIADRMYLYTIVAYKNKVRSNYSKFTRGWAERVKLVSPKNVVAKVRVYSKSINLRWNIVKGAMGYNIWRWDTQLKKWILIKKTLLTKYTDKKVKSGIRYGYVIAAYSNVRQGPFSKTVSAGLGLRSPMGFRASQGERSYIKIRWNKVKGAKHYLLYKWNRRIKKWDKIQNITNNFFIDRKVRSGEKYFYTVTAFGKGGWSPLSKYVIGWSKGKDLSNKGWRGESNNKGWE